MPVALASLEKRLLPCSLALSLSLSLSLPATRFQAHDLTLALGP